MGAWLSTPGDRIFRPSPYHRSVQSSQPTFLVFHNATSHHVRVHWIDYSGRKRIYSILEPGAVHIQSTFLSHPWTMDILASTPKPGEELPAIKFGTLSSDFSSNNLVDLSTQHQIIYPSGTAAKKVTIVDSPPVPWCIYSHDEFFSEYKDTVKEVMLYYSRMSKLQGITQRVHLGDLPMVSFLLGTPKCFISFLFTFSNSPSITWYNSFIIAPFNPHLISFYRVY